MDSYGHGVWAWGGEQGMCMREVGGAGIGLVGVGVGVGMGMGNSLKALAIKYDIVS